MYRPISGCSGLGMRGNFRRKSGARADEGDVHRLGFVSQLYKLYDFTDFMNLSYRLANIAFLWYSGK
jgi:hypothetical protein